MPLNRVRPNAARILGMLLASTPAWARVPENESRITLRLYDYVNLPVGSRAEMTAQARRALNQAGVASAFLECYLGGVESDNAACRAPLGPRDLMPRIFPPKLAVQGKQLGYAAMTPEGGAYITVFSDPKQRKARVGGLGNGTLLGHAVAHEVGHLLPGPHAHSAAGIVRPQGRPCDEEWMLKGAPRSTPGKRGGCARLSSSGRAGRGGGRPKCRAALICGCR